MPKVDLDRPLTLQDGETPMKMQPDKDDVATLRDPVMGALLAEFMNDAGTPMLKYRLYTLQHQCRGGGAVELDANDIDLIEKRSLAVHPAWLFGQVSDGLNGREAPKDVPLTSPAPMPELPPDAA
jgi:hypothetical protein